MKEKVGVIITTYQREPEMLLRAIGSVMQQTYTNWQLIVVDDSHSDYPYREKVLAAIRIIKDERISFIKNKKNIGACASRNRGALCCEGTEYLAFLDDDDEWMPNKLEEMINCFSSPRIGLVYALSYLHFDETGNIHNLSDGRIFPEGNIFLNLLGNNVIGSTSYPILRRSVFEEAGGFCESLGALQDWELWLRIAALSEIAFVDAPLTIYHIHNKDRISSHPEKRVEGFEYLYKKYKKFYKKSWKVKSEFFLTGAEFYAEAERYIKALQYLTISLILSPFTLRRNKRAVIFFLRQIKKAKDKLNLSKKIKSIVAQSRFLYKRYYCSACNQNVAFLEGFGIREPVIEALEIVGAGFRKKVVCPICGANDRVRWIDYVIQNHTDIYVKELNILHIAPESIIEKKIRKVGNRNYVTGDILEGKADYVVDLTNMQFEDSKFDYIIANHVLEHIEEEEKAFMEMKRCLTRDGILILSFPISLNRNTFSRNDIVTKKDRTKYYGQEDHCRVYGKDIKKYLLHYGLELREYNVSSIYTKDEIKRKAMMENDRVYLGVFTGKVRNEHQ